MKVVAGALAILLMAGCGTAAQPQEGAPVSEIDSLELRAKLAIEGRSEVLKLEGCEALNLFKLTTPEAYIEFVESLGGIALPDYGIDSDITPELRAELTRRIAILEIRNCNL